ncbi:MAG: DNA-processing protein DprA [Streptosporangiaceae bacterium]
MIAALDRQRVARAVLTYLAEPGDPVLAALLDVGEAADIVAAVAAGRLPAGLAGRLSGWAPGCLPGAPSEGLPASPPGRQSAGPQDATLTAVPAPERTRRGRRTAAARLEHALGTWRNRLGGVPAEMDLARFHRDGIRLVCPGEPEWPTQLDVLGAARPYALWLRGEADLRYCCLRSVSVVGARAATAYGAHVGTEMAAALAERGWTVISGGAYGIDGCAHRGALAADGVSIAVLACGVDRPYPPGHQDLLTGVCAQGVLVSEWPPGQTPTRRRFLIRNRVIGALSRGTVVVEAGLRSGALNTARHARDLGRPLMAVPGPVTSEVSAGCHMIMREWGAVCVTGAADVIEMLAPLGEPGAGRPLPVPGERPGSVQEGLWPGPLSDGAASGTSVPDRQRGPLLARAALDALTIDVLEAIPARGAGPATIAVAAGLGVDAVVRSLGLLAAGGYVERCARGWRIRTPAG